MNQQELNINHLKDLAGYFMDVPEEMEEDMTDAFLMQAADWEIMNEITGIFLDEEIENLLEADFRLPDATQG